MKPQFEPKGYCFLFLLNTYYLPVDIQSKIGMSRNLPLTHLQNSTNKLLNMFA